MTLRIKKTAILGAGVMGSGIAAHLAGAGIEVLLLDIVPPDAASSKDKAVRNTLADNGLKNALKARPAAFFHKEFARLIKTGNFEDDFEKIKDCDWIVEVVLERMDVKQKVFEKVEKFANDKALITSNTSGLSIKGMTEGRSESFKKRFFVTHFFNPVRYMKLLELVPGEKTDMELFKEFAKWGEETLGKGIVYGKDTPNFVANRIGVYSMMNAIGHMIKAGLRVDEVDAVAGPALGRPKSAAFRTVDIVGVDTFAHVSRTVYDNCPNDERRDEFKIPEFIDKMIEKKLLGQKSKSGFYKREKKADGGKDDFVIDYNTLEYVPKVKAQSDSLKFAKKTEDLSKRIKGFIEFDDKFGKFAWAGLRDSLIYAGNRLGEITDEIYNIDNGMKWGFNWEMGPFEVWDAIGVEESVKRMESEGFTPPKIAKALLAKGYKTFYKKETGKSYYFDLKKNDYALMETHPDVLNLADFKTGERTLKKNPGSNLIDLGDGVLCLEFNTKMNAIDDDILRMTLDAVDEAEKNYEALILANQAENFSVGANLMLIFMGIQAKEWEKLDGMVRLFQNAVMRLRYSDIPTVSAPFGFTFGGGCEFAMGCDATVAAAETYIGLVEVGVGLLPAGSGTKELTFRMAEAIPEGVQVDPFQFNRKAFENIAMAKVSTSGFEAIGDGYLRKTDRVVLDKAKLISEAKKVAKGMAVAGYKRPKKRMVTLPGRAGYANYEMVVWSLKEQGMISEHDQKIAMKIAKVVTGGDISPKQPVEEQYLLDLEREAFLSLCGEQKTQERIQYMLMNNKPLRN